MLNTIIDEINISNASRPYPLVLQPPASTGPRLEEPFGIIRLSRLQSKRLGLRANTTPIILTVVRVVHKQWSIHVGKKTLVDVLLDYVAHSLVELDGGRIDLAVIDGQAVGVVEFNDNVRLIRGNVEEVLGVC